MKSDGQLQGTLTLYCISKDWQNTLCPGVAFSQSLHNFRFVHLISSCFWHSFLLWVLFSLVPSVCPFPQQIMFSLGFCLNVCYLSFRLFFVVFFFHSVAILWFEVQNPASRFLLFTTSKLAQVRLTYVCAFMLNNVQLFNLHLKTQVKKTIIYMEKGILTISTCSLL